jgi:hypothetical protein
MLIYTSVTKSYLPKARVLAKSVKRFHPDWTFVLLYSDDLPVGFDLKQEPFDEVLTIEQLGIPNLKSWAFGHTVVELCTAVKGAAAEFLAQRPTVDKIMYIDPDIKLFSSLSSLKTLLDQYEILLTPHLLDAETEINAIQDNEISALKHGVFNLGFFAARTSGQGLDFIRWWAERLRLFCRDDIPNGLFTDQRWCDLAPAFFSNLCIVRDRGCNVATWNIAHRPLSKNDAGMLLVAGTPLRFYHFTGYDNGSGAAMLMRYASNQAIAHELWDMYRKDLLAEGQGDPRYRGWIYGQFENGETIPHESRKFYLASQDIQKAFPEPYSVVEPCFLSWWKAALAEGSILSPTITNIKQKTLIQLVMQCISSPSYGLHIVRSVIIVFKTEGALGLVRRIRNY